MNYLIINCHWDNRGDEAAIRSMIDEITKRHPDAIFFIQRALGTFEYFPEYKNVIILPEYPETGKLNGIKSILGLVFRGKVFITNAGERFYEAIVKSDMILHAPGGPSIGDLYRAQEIKKLIRLMIAKAMKKDYGFYAPSMGPFLDKKRNIIRKRIINNAKFVCVRESISSEYVKDLCPKRAVYVTLDSAMQFDINIENQEKILAQDEYLRNFISQEKVIGVTVTDLQWNAMYKGNVELVNRIKDTFIKMVVYLINNGYKVLFIPQLFGNSNDYLYMSEFCINSNCYILNDKYDTYFQQYIISKLYAVIGMRYHSNIFSAKGGTPFISISYEQKMEGFMSKAELDDYCVSIDSLSFEEVCKKFKKLVSSYDIYKKRLVEMHETWKNEAKKTTDIMDASMNMN